MRSSIVALPRADQRTSRADGISLLTAGQLGCLAAGQFAVVTEPVWTLRTGSPVPAVRVSWRAAAARAGSSSPKRRTAWPVGSASTVTPRPGVAGSCRDRAASARRRRCPRRGGKGARPGPRRGPGSGNIRTGFGGRRLIRWLSRGRHSGCWLETCHQGQGEGCPVWAMLNAARSEHRGRSHRGPCPGFGRAAARTQPQHVHAGRARLPWSAL
jgi:hypothetical protein